MSADSTDHKDAPHRGRKFRGKRLKTALPRPPAEAAPQAAKTADRIAKVMARAGVASRREAEAWIVAGRVSVNGAAISSPALNVTAKDRITVDGQPLPVRERTRLFLFHKPRGLVTTSADPDGRPTIFGALPKDLPRLVSVGRLDLNTEGLLLLTNDGGLARALELPSTGWLRRYRVRAHGAVTQARLDGLRQGIEVDGVRYGAIEAALDREQGANIWLTFAMREGKNREIRNVLGALGLQVNRLIRVSYGPFQLGELPAGAVMEVSTRALREQLGERLAALAGADFSGPIAEREPQRPQAVRPTEPRTTRHPKGDHRSETKPGSAGRTPEKGKPHRGPKEERRQRHEPRAEGQRHRGSRSDGPERGARPAARGRHRKRTR